MTNQRNCGFWCPLSTVAAIAVALALVICFVAVVQPATAATAPIDAPAFEETADSANSAKSCATCHQSSPLLGLSDDGTIEDPPPKGSGDLARVQIFGDNPDDPEPLPPVGGPDRSHRG